MPGEPKFNENEIERKRPTRCAIILKKNNNQYEILLIKRAKDHLWALVSGIGKSNIQDEVECDLGTNSFVGEETFTIPVEGSKKTDKIIVFVGHMEKESEITLKEGFSEGFKWIPLKQAVRETLAFEHNEILERYREAEEARLEARITQLEEKLEELNSNASSSMRDIGEKEEEIAKRKEELNNLRY